MYTFIEDDNELPPHIFVRRQSITDRRHTKAGVVYHIPMPIVVSRPIENIVAGCIDEGKCDYHYDFDVIRIGAKRQLRQCIECGEYKRDKDFAYDSRTPRKLSFSCTKCRAKNGRRSWRDIIREKRIAQPAPRYEPVEVLSVYEVELVT